MFPDLVFVFVFVSVLLLVGDVHSQSNCKPLIIERISKSNNCPKDVLNKLHEEGPWAHVLNPVDAVPEWVRCVSTTVDQPSDQTTGQHVVINYKNSSFSPFMMDYMMLEEECGHLKEWDVYLGEYQTHILISDPVLCYYKCTFTLTDGEDFGACAVPVDRSQDKEVLAAVEECKSKLAAVGINTLLVPLEPCAG